ncbi:MAG: lysophospholipid acyltransferase family protein [Anaerolineae bacterium]
MTYDILRLVVRFFFAVLTRVEVRGRENVPSEGALLLVFNHLGHLDPPLTLAMLPRPFTGIAVIGLRDVPVTGWLLRLAKVIWVNRGQYDREALRRGLQVLSDGGILGIAPEGRISLTGALEQGKTGPAFLARRADVPLLPVAITGTEKAAAEWKRLRRPRLSLTIGEPFRLEAEREGLSRKQQLRADADYIVSRLARMLPPEYRGVYADAVPAV